MTEDAAAPRTADEVKLPYRQPELRDIGLLAEITGAGGPPPNFDGSGYAGGS